MITNLDLLLDLIRRYEKITNEDYIQARIYADLSGNVTNVHPSTDGQTEIKLFDFSNLQEAIVEMLKLIYELGDDEPREVQVFKNT
jgi:hypothetical protein